MLLGLHNSTSCELLRTRMLLLMVQAMVRRGLKRDMEKFDPSSVLMTQEQHNQLDDKILSGTCVIYTRLAMTVFGSQVQCDLHHVVCISLSGSSVICQTLH